MRICRDTQAKLTQLEQTGSERERILDRLEWEIKEITEVHWKQANLKPYRKR